MTTNRILPVLLLSLVAVPLGAGCKDDELIPVSGAGGQNGGQGGVSGQGGAGQSGAGTSGAGMGGAGQSGAGQAGVSGAGASGKSGAAGSPTGTPVPDCNAPGPSATMSKGACRPVDDFFTCNPVTNEPCNTAAGATCDYSGSATSTCYPPPNQQKVCEPCSNNAQLFCGPGLACFLGTNTCARYCCDDSDCGTSGKCALDVILPANLRPYGPGLCVVYEEGTGGQGGGAGGPPTKISDACVQCTGTNCGAEFNDCDKDPTCGQCALVDATNPACQTNENFKKVLACTCKASACGEGNCKTECESFNGAAGGAGAAGGSGSAGASGSAGESGAAGAAGAAAGAAGAAAGTAGAAGAAGGAG